MGQMGTPEVLLKQSLLKATPVVKGMKRVWNGTNYEYRVKSPAELTRQVRRGR